MCHRQHTHTTQHFTMRLREKNKRQRCRNVSATAADVAAFIFADLPDIDDVDVIWRRRTVGVQFPSQREKFERQRQKGTWHSDAVQSTDAWRRNVFDQESILTLSFNWVVPGVRLTKQLKHDCTSSFFSKRLLYLKYTPKKSHHVRSNHSSLHMTWFTQECVFLHANRMFYIHNPEHDMYQQLLSG